MWVCSKCRKPVDQCICTAETKEYWLRECTQRIEERMNLIRHLEEHLQRMKHERITLQEKLESLDYQNNSYEIEENLWKAASTLEQKGYALAQYAWSHLETSCPRGIEISFQHSYWFDFTDFPSKKGWEYNQHLQQLRFALSSISDRVLQKSRMTPEEYLAWQQKLLAEWAEQLPNARLLEKGQKVEGIIGSGALRQRV